ncbi:MAG: hypothetical protein OXG51_11620, partial [Gammaproteobacteria bacterium]|nr:hypothetical protein [Gammaproteobacteria bacterium]
MSETKKDGRVEQGVGLPEVLERIESLRPLIEKESAFGDAERRLSPKVLEAMKQAGFYRLAYPKAVGGTEMA